MASQESTSLSAIFAELGDSLKELILDFADRMLDQLTLTLMRVLSPLLVKSEQVMQEGEERSECITESPSAITVTMYQREETYVDWGKYKTIDTLEAWGWQTKDRDRMEWDFVSKIKHLKRNSSQPKFKFWKEKAARKGGNYCIDYSCLTGQKLLRKARLRRRRKKKV